MSSFYASADSWPNEIATSRRVPGVGATARTMFVTGVLCLALSLVVAAAPAAKHGDGSTSPASVAKPLCTEVFLPREVEKHLETAFGSWKIQQLADLSATALARWKDEKPLECPGIAAGHFERSDALSYAVLLVPKGHVARGYTLLVFNEGSHSAGAGRRRPYEAMVLERWDRGARDVFIRGVEIRKFFDAPSRRKFDARSKDGILFVEAAEKEYGTDIFYWTKGGFRHDPVDR